MFPSISPKQSFPALESEVLAYWKANNTFQKSIDSRPENNPYRFYDGPPFITGTPHYGSLLSSIVKDVVGRYWTMRGRRVDRIWGWDCHGLPIEEKVMKKLGLGSNKEIEERGVKEFINGCYEYTQSTSAEWDWYIDKIGRWVDMDRAYRTMDQEYMESVMWVFRQLWDKGLIYEGKRVSLYSWKLGTPISNFEVAMDDTYQEVNDPAVTVKFRLEDQQKVLIINGPCGSGKSTIAKMVSEKYGYKRINGDDIWNSHKHLEWNNRINTTNIEILEEAKRLFEKGDSVVIDFVFESKKDITLFRDVFGAHLEHKILFPDISICKERDGGRHDDTVGGSRIEELYKTLKSNFDDKNIFIDNSGETEIETFEKNFQKKPIYILAWTTTPWTIPANMALAVRNDIDYVLVNLLEKGGGTSERSDGGLEVLEDPENQSSASQAQQLLSQGAGTEQFIVAKNRVESVFKGKGEYTIIREFKGSELVGLGYIPPFPEYYYNKKTDTHTDTQKNNKKNSDITTTDSDVSSVPVSVTGSKNHKIYHADFITDTDGTGIGHEAPEFGDVDFQLAKKEGIFISEAMDEAGKYTSQIFDYEGLHYQEANKVNIERMKENDTLFKLESITHRVPFCPRSATPLVQKAQKSWFIDIQSQKEKLLKANEQINWFPEHLKFGRFAKGIESAPDWCISRTRYWGAPMPVWQNKDASERIVVSSREEIFKMNKPYGQLTKLIITRHAESEANVAKHYDDVGTSPLSPKGKEQALGLIEELKDQGVDIIITSPFLRAVQTAEPLAKELGIEIFTDERLKETDHGKLANASSLERYDEIHYARNKVFEDKIYKFGETGESYIDLKDRMQSFIDDICQRYPGKTVFVVSHGFPVRVLTEELTGKAPKTTKNAHPRTFILDIANKKQLNLHKPYIDSVFLAPKNTQKAKKVLGVHGFRRTESVIDFFAKTKENLEKQGVLVNCPFFEEGETVNYENWKKVFLENIEGVDTVFAHSLGCRFSLDMIIKYQIPLKRLVLIAPPEGKHERLKEFFEHLREDVSEINKYAEEVIVLYSIDDKEGRVLASRELIEKTNGLALKMNGFGHFNVTESKLIEGLIQYGSPLTRIPEVLDVWMDSGSMPYAQMHYPFENKGEMEASFPADFIAEYVGQVRAWFYVMHVLGVLLGDLLEKGGGTNAVSDGGLEKTATQEDQSSVSHSARQLLSQGAGPRPAFTNVITTGVINGNDGRKMSKSYGNYPDPRATIEKYGADPIRFYMLNSPLLSGGDMDFKEEQIIETVKGVMLPLWNTYSFFTTYANIDNWEPDGTEVWFSRHGESTSNVAMKMSDGTDDPDLTEKGREQARNAGKTLKDQGKDFDVIIHTSKARARDTAHLIGENLGFIGEYIEDDRFSEHQAGEYAGKTHAEIREIAGLSPDSSNVELRKAYKNNSLENIAQFEARITEAYKDILAKYKGKKILIVAHAGTSRPILNQYFGQGTEYAHFHANIKNAEPFRLITTPLVNDLDRWILSKLQVLLGQVHDAMDGYDISRACRAIVDYMDHLTNWYVRLSRRRFWESGMTPDKNSAYETLYTVLVELSKLLAPYMPFLAESVYRGLTSPQPSPKGEGVNEDSSSLKEKGLGDEANSVHLQYVTFPSRHLIATDLNRDMEKCENIVSLGLALRSQKNIRVRQPLQSVTITAELDPYYQAIIMDELNVKEIKLENPEKLAKKIAKPDAKKIGPKYGKDVQYIITEAKKGNFVEKEDGQIVIARSEMVPSSGGAKDPTHGTIDSSQAQNDKQKSISSTPNISLPTSSGFTLEIGEYSMEYIPLEGVGDVVGGYGMVLAMDTVITESLQLEGYARDIIRLIQDMRKEAGYEVTDRIKLSIIGEDSNLILSRFGKMIESETLSTLIAQIDNPDTMREESIDEDNVVQIAIKR